MTFTCQVYDPTSGDSFQDSANFSYKEAAEERRRFLSTTLLGVRVTIIITEATAHTTKTIQYLNPLSKPTKRRLKAREAFSGFPKGDQHDRANKEKPRD